MLLVTFNSVIKPGAGLSVSKGSLEEERRKTWTIDYFILPVVPTLLFHQGRILGAKDPVSNVFSTSYNPLP